LAAAQQPLSLPEGEITTIEIHRSNPYIQLGISIVGGNETPLINIVIQEVYRDGIIARDGRLLAGDQILQVSVLVILLICVFVFVLISLKLRKLAGCSGLCLRISPASQEAEIRRTMVQGQPAQNISGTPISISSLVWWLKPVFPTSKEA
jgi:tetrahydromethanopterin S-methyltransferase subunit F